ncbi:putative RING-H2 finger protein ATL21A [Lycium ferocissimum]|uniref:putative RING-H2 finger protein ATL21A n=1 Tax=Lycium ferocissimum TaxID=112874 RepID=UPI0028151FA0|nr:putative RING-H2 finger protein ATL21A [Lycium ferocissimum]
MDNLLIFFVSFLLFSSIYAKHDCPLDSICGNNRFDIRFPFGLEGPENLQHCTYPGFNLKCNNQGRAILNLPGAGDFYVRDIDYLTQEIQLYDPSNCLPKRLINFQFPPSSNFKAVFYRNYTFLTCSTDLVTSKFSVIGCMSNSTISTLATSSMSLANQMKSLYNCSVLNSTLPLPVSWTPKYEAVFSSDLNNDLVLIWDEPNCQDCEAKRDFCGFKNSTNGEIQCFDVPGTGNAKGIQIFRIVALSLVIPAITCSMAVTCYICYEQSRDSRRAAAALQNTTGGAAIAPQPETTNGLDDSTIESYTKVVLGESRRVPGPNHGTCPICLGEYHAKEIVRSIPECEHCFHAECIDEWLKINGTCPVCRNTPSPAHVNSS